MGLKIDNYHVIEELGRGGFGRVYRAWDSKLERDVALKFLKDPLDPTRRKLFEREAKAIASLSKHRSIIQIYGWGEYAERVYFAVEYLTGSVERLLQRCPNGIAPSEAVRITGEAADALDFAHQQGILHRDIKPDNLLLDDATGQVKVADFGFASFYESKDSAALGEAICGSPSYMSPEQASGRVLDPRTDIYSLGVTLYRLLTGRLPFEGSSFSEVLDRVRNDQRIPLRDRRPDLPQAVLEVVAKATAHEPEQRFRTAGEFAAECKAVGRTLPPLEEGSTTLLPSEAGQAAPSAPRLKRRLVVRAALVVVAIAAAVVTGVCVLFWKTSFKGPIAYADRLVDQGDLATAEQAYLDFLSENPAHGQALEGLGYALLLQGKYPEAEACFDAIQDDALKTEGMSALAYYRQDDTARERLEQAARSGASPFPQVLLGTLDLVAQQYEAVIRRLAAIERRQLRFGWQFERCLQTLGQAHYHLDDLDQALAIFQGLSSADSPIVLAAASAYVDLIERKARAELAESNRQRLRDLSERMKEMDYTPPTKEELWTSRPLRFLILPPTQGKSAYAAESGLADWLPDLLGDALESGSKLDWVDREELDVVLAEQELSAYLSSDHDQLHLGRLLGARVIVKSAFRSLLQEEFLTTKVVDTETGERMSAGELPLLRQEDPREVVRAAADAVKQVLAGEYPLCGRLHVGPDGPTVDIGDTVGVTRGMRFVVSDRPDRRTSLPGVSVQVQGPPGTDSATVVLQGIAPEQIPAEGLYVIEEGWYRSELGPAG